jgi:molybdopterin-guanine dinucleotide biosynthesis protein A
MAPPKGKHYNLKARVGQFAPSVDKTVPVNVKVPRSIAEKLESLLEEGETRSKAVVEAIKLLIEKRSQENQAQ